ncbi:DapH/DapD/GlmU-related protein [Variovorax sp. J22R133]|uniref:DapH/DapD/GlmU-related protein n=1 Tax=Variovorax brevis TaxID=3053503 RepID=UPI002577BC90|nr:DapH/DapD/GlmU-related protein [Variovorax sp. J22R133]MDM0115253.1 DapH/DapD/GlmU-related protein [Variovorax sp. J22R133]
MPSKKFVIGTGSLLVWAVSAWAEVSPEELLIPIDVGQDADYRFELGALDDVSPQDATAFVVWGSQFLNFRRLELMGELKARGFKLPPLVCKGAIVSSSATLGENCAVGAASVVGSGCKIGFNSHIGAGAIIGHHSIVGTSAWIADGAQLGVHAKIGANASLGRSVVVDDGVSIGRQCVLDLPGRRSSPLPDKTFITTAFPTGIVVVDGGGAISTS